MNFKNIFTAIIKQPFFIDLAVNKLFSRSKFFAFDKMENSLEEIKVYLVEKKIKLEKTPNPYDEKLLMIGISALKSFSGRLHEVLSEVQPD